MSEHPIQQSIREIDVYLSDEGSTVYSVGRNGVTRIEACEKSGMYSSIPYVRVWKDDACEGEFCQHNIVGVYFDPTPEAVLAEADQRAKDCKAAGIPNIVGDHCTTCDLPVALCDCIPF